ncbi:hypothetical protein L596_024695 [Steinernema carpocapsae]|uniref:Uncharacterized protein n=1 Tax=Steinernema carpocapsae TaxID=34508 RepID=A0A4U5M5H6_STECR|nr:hypothetical protein L596_024695 [Steinernema carpocapsae]
MDLQPEQNQSSSPSYTVLFGRSTPCLQRQRFELTMNLGALTVEKQTLFIAYVYLVTSIILIPNILIAHAHFGGIILILSIPVTGIGISAVSAIEGVYSCSHSLVLDFCHFCLLPSKTH